MALSAASVCFGAQACTVAAEAPVSNQAEEADSPEDAGAYCADPARFVAAGEVVLERDPGDAPALWQRRVSPSLFPLAGALAYCAALRLDRRRWRLPTVDELASLLIHPRGLGGSRAPTCEPSIDQAAFPATPSADFWTSTERPDRGEAFYTGFDDGRSHLATADTPMFVRCVSAGEPP
jgi:hypothetical protein